MDAKMLITELGLAVDVGRHFDALGVRWLVGGSVASSILGCRVPRLRSILWPIFVALT